MSTKQPKRILIFGLGLETFSRQLLQGIVQYAHGTRDWMYSIHSEPAGLLDVARVWKPHGLLYRGSRRIWERRLQPHLKVPFVNVGWPEPGWNAPTVGTDQLAVGRMAAEHLLQRGIRRFGYAGVNVPYSQAQLRGFNETLARSGFSCRVLLHSPPRKGVYSPELRVQTTLKWLKSFQFPVGILVSLDPFGIRIAQACARKRLRIPEDVAVVGTGNDEVYCQMMWPALTSIERNGQREGHEAAAILNRLMRGLAAPKRAKLIPPRRLVPRGSTDVVAVSDDYVAAAARFIRDHRAHPIGVQEVAEHVGVSRRLLEHRFRQSLNRTPAEEIRRQRVEHAKALLRETDFKVRDVAEACHFASDRDFWRLFRRVTGMTPSQYRDRERTA